VSELFDLFLSILFTLVQWRLSRTLWRKHPRRRAHAAILLFNAAVLFGYACTFADPPRSMNLPGYPAELIGAVAMTYLITASVVLPMHWAIRRLRSHFDRPAEPARRKLLEVASNAALAAPVAFVGYGTFIERTNFHVREIDVPVANLGPGLEGLRILQLSDIHMGAFLSERELAKIVDASKEHRAHLAVVTGDLISLEGDPLDACIRQLARIKTDAGAFGCMGNHERYALAEDYCQEAAARVGIRFLRKEAEILHFGGSALNLAGVDHQSRYGGRKYLVAVDNLKQPDSFNLLLSHNPDVLPVAAQQGWDLMLSGHTHGGQINVEILDQAITPGRFLTPYIYGKYQMQNTAAYVTRGIGTVGIPARIGAPPEITVIRLRKA
jgi:predicted MPP superfamily phosphohydrolase